MTALSSLQVRYASQDVLTSINVLFAVISSKQFAVLLQALPHLKASAANRAAIVPGQRSKDTTNLSGTTVT